MASWIVASVVLPGMMTLVQYGVRRYHSRFVKLGPALKPRLGLVVQSSWPPFFVPCRSLLLTQCYRGKQLIGSGFAAPAPANDTHIVET